MNDTGESTMEGRTNIDDFLTVRGFGGGIGGLGGNYMGGAVGLGAPYAGLGSIQHGLAYNGQQVENQADCTRSVIGLQVNASQQAFENLTRQQQFNELKDGQFRAGLRDSDRIAAVQKEINDNAKDAARYYCEVKVQAANDKAELKSDIKDLEVSRLKDELAKSRDKNNISETVERTLAAFKNCGCCGDSHHGRG